MSVTPPYCITLPKHLQGMYGSRGRWAAVCSMAMLLCGYLLFLLIAKPESTFSNRVMGGAALVTLCLFGQFEYRRARWHRRIGEFLAKPTAYAQGYAYPAQLKAAEDGTNHLVVEMQISQFKVFD